MAGTRDRPLYAVTEQGKVTFVGDRHAASAFCVSAPSGSIRRLHPLTDHEAAVYVREGCAGLTCLFASIGRVRP